MTIDEALRHAGDLRQFSPEVVQGVADFMPGYLWVMDNWMGDTGLEAYDVPDVPCRLIRCGRCGWTDIEEKRGGRYPGSYPHNEVVRCPHCCAEVTVKHPSKGIKSMANRLDAVFYRKSAVDPGVVVALAAHCTRFFCRADVSEPWELEPEISVRGIAVFDVAHRDDIRIQSRPLWQQHETGTLYMAGTVWKRVKSMKSLQFGDEVLFMGQRPDRAALTDTFETAIHGTPIERAWSDKYWNGTDGIMALDMITRRPCVEYMTKLGLESFVTRQLNGTLPPRLVNWSGGEHGEGAEAVPGAAGPAQGQGHPPDRRPVRGAPVRGQAGHPLRHRDRRGRGRRLPERGGEHRPGAG